MANKIEVAQAYVSIIPSMAGSQEEITKDLTGVTNPASEKAGEEGGSKFGSKFASAIKGATAAIGAAMAAATGAAIATGKAFIDSANDVAEYGNTVDKMSQKMGISAQAYQEWDFILQHAGANIEGMKTSMLKLTKAAEGGSDAFTALGISQEQLATMSQEEIFTATVAALQGVQDEAQRTVLANELLGKGATELAPLFNMSAGEVEAMRQQVHDLGGVMSDEAVKDAAAYEDAMQNMNTALEGIKKGMMSDFLPGITSVMDGLSKVFSGNGGVEEIQSGLESVISNLTNMAPQFFTLAETLINSLIAGFAPQAPALVTTIFNVLNQALITLATMLPQLMPAITTGLQTILSALFQSLPLITQSLLTLVSDLLVWLSSGDNINTFINGIIKLVSLIANQLSEVLPVLLPAIVRIIGEVANTLASPENIETIVAAAITILASIIVALIEATPELINFVIESIKNVSGLLGDFFSFIVPYVAAAIEAMVNKIKDWGAQAKQFILNLINGIKTSFTNWLTNLKNSFLNAFNYIRDKISDITNKAKNLVTNLINTIKELPQKVVAIGKNLIEGLWNGINDKIGWVKNKISGMGSAITSAIKGVLGIASPSKLWKDEVGAMLALGLGEGFTDEMDDVTKQMEDSVENLTGNMSAEVTANGTTAAARMEPGTQNNYNGGAITINVYGAQGQDINSLAQQIAQKLEEMTERKRVAYA